jgi:hypothetical protein
MPASCRNDPVRIAYTIATIPRVTLVTPQCICYDNMHIIFHARYANLVFFVHWPRRAIKIYYIHTTGMELLGIGCLLIISNNIYKYIQISSKFWYPMWHNTNWKRRKGCTTAYHNNHIIIYLILIYAYMLTITVY